MPHLYPKTAVMVILGSISMLIGGYMSNPLLMAMGMGLIISPLVSYSFFQFSTGKLELLQVERWTDKTDVFKGEYLYVRIKVKNQSNRSLNLIEITDQLPEALKLVMGENTLHAPINPKEEITFSYVLHCPKRGKYELGPTNATIKDTFSYFYETLQSVPSQTIYVCPTLEDVRRLDMLEKRGMDILSGIHETKIKGAGIEFFGLREYVPGDEYRRIDWKATARLLKPVVKEYETERKISLMLLLDTSLSMAGGPENQTKLDYAIRASVLIASLALKRGDKVGLLLYSNEVGPCLYPAGGRKRFYDILRVLAEVKPEGVPAFKKAMNQVLQGLKDQTLLFVITDLEDDPHSIVEPIHLAKDYGHQVVIVSPFGSRFEKREEEILQNEVARIYAEAVEESILDERETLISELKAIGFTVIDVSPEDLLPVVLGEYLKAKASGIATGRFGR